MADNTQRIVWTACPAGLTRDRRFYRINLHVSPRLVPGTPQDASVGDFRPWIDWPATLAAARFSVHGLRPGQPIEARLAPDAAGEWPPRDKDDLLVPDSRTWSLLFPKDTPVISHAFDDFRGMDVLTYPLAALAEAIEATYAGLAVQGGGLPRASDLRRIELFNSRREKPSLKSLLGILRDTDSDKQLAAQPGLMLALLEAYHRPLAAPVIVKADKRTIDGKPDPRDPHEDAAYRSVDRVPMPKLESFRENLDFHRIVAAVGQHPALMRLAGLVVPLLVPAGEVTPGPHVISVDVDWHDLPFKPDDSVSCETRAMVTADGFIARPATALLVDGWLRAGDDRFDLVQLDVDGAGLTVKNLASQLPRIAEERFDDEAPHDPVARVGAPRLRTAGIQFAQSRRDVAIRGLFDSAGSHDDTMNNGTPVVLAAEDLIKGWRVDVLDITRNRAGTGRGWQSLMRFDGRYSFTADPLELLTRDEEATARLAAAATADDNADAATKNILKASEALFGWTGWSLAAPPPGRTMLPDYDETDDVPMREEPGDAPNTVPPGLPLQTAFRPHPASLPVLRFAHAYRVRLRSVDLAGWGPPPTADEVEIPGIESAIVRFGRYEPLETPALTVIEGDPAPAEGESMPRAALRTMQAPNPDTVIVRRNVHPARVGHRFAELHGVIDGPDGKPRADLYTALATRDAAFPEDTALTKAWPAPAPEGEPQPPAAEVPTSFARSPEHGPTPYPADPLAGGAAIRVTGLADPFWDEVQFVPFYGDEWDPVRPLDWLKDDSFAIVATEDGTPGWDAARRQFVVPLARAERARLHISAVMPDEDITKLKLREIIIREQGEARWKKIEPIVRAGQHWMFTPSRMVELVHAVQKPLITPSVAVIGANRDPGAVAATLGFRTPIHAKSTARLDIEGDWIDIDDSAPGGPVVRRVSAHGFDRKLFRLEAPSHMLAVSGEHVFADTRARRVDYVAIATTRFREYMPEHVRLDRAAITVTSPVQSLWIPSASRPPAPAVRYIIPTFGWSRSEADGGADNGLPRRSWRRGGGLRVYLDRPWFASGSNEMLAVCLPRGSADPQVNQDKNHVTMWGADPTWISDSIDSVAPAAGDFPLRIRSGGTLPYAIAPEAGFGPVDPSPDGAALPGFATGPYRPHGAPAATQVDIVPHAVGYDSDRQLWYADIVVNPHDTYMPFIRLALARFQPASVAGHHLSATVFADFAQLTPDRLVITSNGSLPGQRMVAIHGIEPARRGLPSAGNFRIELQRLRDGGDPDLDWQRIEQAPTPPPPLGGPQNPGRIPGGNPGGPFGRVERIRALTPADRIRLVEAERLIEAGRFTELLRSPGLLEMIRPPLIFQASIFLPERQSGDRLRLLITEFETYETGPAINPAEPRVDRIVFAEAVEV